MRRQDTPVIVFSGPTTIIRRATDWGAVTGVPSDGYLELKEMQKRWELESVQK